MTKRRTRAIIIKSKKDDRYGNLVSQYDVLYGFNFVHSDDDKTFVNTIMKNWANITQRKQYRTYNYRLSINFLEKHGIKQEKEYIMINADELIAEPAKKKIQMKRQRPSRWHPPTEATEGVVGEFFYCAKDKKVYTCTEVKYKWVEFDDRTREDLLEEILTLRNKLEAKGGT